MHHILFITFLLRLSWQETLKALPGLFVKKKKRKKDVPLVEYCGDLYDGCDCGGIMGLVWGVHKRFCCRDWHSFFRGFRVGIFILDLVGMK